MTASIGQNPVSVGWVFLLKLFQLEILEKWPFVLEWEDSAIINSKCSRNSRSCPLSTCCQSGYVCQTVNTKCRSSVATKQETTIQPNAHKKSFLYHTDWESFDSCLAPTSDSGFPLHGHHLWIFSPDLLAEIVSLEGELSHSFEHPQRHYLLTPMEIRGCFAALPFFHKFSSSRSSAFLFWRACRCSAASSKLYAGIPGDSAPARMKVPTNILLSL